MKKNLFLVGLLAALSSSAFAGDFYAGGNIGTATNNNAGTGLTKTSDTAFSLLGGYKINDNFAAELAYMDLGKTAQGTITAKNTSTNLSAVGILPFGKGVSGFGKLGYGSSRVAVSNGTSASRNDFNYGLGAQYDMDHNLSFRAGWDQVSLGDAVNVVRSKTNIYSLGATYSF